MKISVKFFVFDLPPGFKDAEFELPDGSTVNDVLDMCLALFRQRRVAMKEDELRTAIIMVGKEWSDPDTPVTDGDVVTILRPMDGG